MTVPPLAPPSEHQVPASHTVTHSLDLPGPIYLIPTNVTSGNLRALGEIIDGAPATVDEVIEDLRLAGGAAATVRKAKGGKPAVDLYTARYKLRLYPRTFKQRHTCYNLGFIGLSRIHERATVARGCLWIRPTQWYVVPPSDLHQLPGDATAHVELIQAEWDGLQQDGSAQGADPGALHRQLRSELLDRLDQVIEAEKRITIAKEAAEPLRFRQIRPVGEQASGTESIYDFMLVGGVTKEMLPDAGSYVQLKDQPRHRGQVDRANRKKVTVKFRDAIDWRSLDGQGQLERSPSTVVFDKQREATDALRNVEPPSSDVLDLLVGQLPRPLHAAPAHPREKVNAEQLDAFHKGLAVDDMLLVLGPPGTGKTHTIRQIAEQVAEAGERVLITSHTHRAVDNVLGELASNLVAVRFGPPHRVTADGKPYLLEVQVPQTCDAARQHADDALGSYSELDTAGEHTAKLGHGLEDLRELLDSEVRALEQLEALTIWVGAPAQAQVDAFQAQLQQHEAAQGRLQDRITRRERLAGKAAGHSHMPGLGIWFRLRAKRHRGRLATDQTAATTSRSNISQAHQQVVAARAARDALLREHPDVVQARAAFDAAATARAQCHKEAVRAATAALDLLHPISSPPLPLPTSPDETGDAGESYQSLVQLHGQLFALLPLLERRRQLLADWRDTISESSDRLRQEILDRADVVATTCIGAATTEALEEVEADVALVDEAGQISLPTVLIPLAKTRRAVLVGDDNQLPPFLDSDVERWGQSIDDPAVSDLLTKSAFEALADKLPESHVVMLREQRRMAQPIADFVSRQFYSGKLVTAVEYPHDQRLFGSPFAFVDTSSLPDDERFEKKRDGAEAWQSTGYTNEAEARLLIDLATYYNQVLADWAIILPYRAQVERVRHELYELIGDSERVLANVGTVDSFQGGERDILLFGFTRSNANGAVGFLNELRRSNVAFSRAKRQLVLVGDMSALCKADDIGFRDMALALREHADRLGSLHEYQDVYARLGDLGADPTLGNQNGGAAS